MFSLGVYKTPYFSFGFKPRGDRKKYIDELYDIVQEIIGFFSKDKVVEFDCQYDIKKNERKPFFKGWIPPEYVEDGKVNEFKQYLIQSNRKDLIWTDYMRYVSKNINFFFFPTEIREYGRNIYIAGKT